MFGAFLYVVKELSTKLEELYGKNFRDKIEFIFANDGKAGYVSIAGNLIDKEEE